MADGRQTLAELEALAHARPPSRRDRLRLTEHGSKIEINGVDLIDLVRAAERPHVQREIAEQLAAGEQVSDFAGTYSGLSDRFLRKALLGDPSDSSVQWFKLAPDDPRRTKSTILGCDCGITECWFLLVRITLLDDAVVWSELEQFHRDWVYDLGPFVFDREPYLAAIEPV